eukprot:2961706-Pyramimonas_sp.AAC.1
MRDDIKHSTFDVHSANAPAMIKIKKKFQQERGVRKELEKQVAALEDTLQSPQHTNTETGHFDENMAVHDIGADAADQFVRDVLDEAASFREVWSFNEKPSVVCCPRFRYREDHEVLEDTEAETKVQGGMFAGF